MKKLYFLILAGATLLNSCGNDDDGGIPGIEQRDPVEVLAEDLAEIEAYLDTHFYNYDEFQNPPAGFDFKVVVDTIAGDNADRIPLREQVIERTIVRFDNDNGGLAHPLFILVARQGGGIPATISDSTFLTFQGTFLDRSQFDSANAPLSFDLAASSTTGEFANVQGFVEGVAQLNGPTGFTENPDGTVSFEDFGSGLVIMPSGLGFFEFPRLGVPSFSPLVFSIQLLGVNPADHDQDGILSIMEDLNGDNVVFNDDTDGDTIPNFADIDDDGDGTLTINEFDEDNDGIPDDTDGDGIPDYLDNRDDRNN